MKLPSDMGPDPETLYDIMYENALLDSLPPKAREAIKTSIGCLSLSQLQTLAARHRAGILDEDQLWQLIEQADQLLRPGTKLGFTPAVKRPSRKR